MSTELVGQLLEGRYRVESILGAGGMGSVYLAIDERSFERKVVLKVPHRDMLVIEGFRERFRLEMQQLVELEHPGVVKVLDIGEVETLPFAVLQYLGGGSLEDRIKERGGSLTVAQVMEWLPSVAAALDFIHSREVLHRDIKPANILFDTEGHAYVADFGIVKVLSDADFATSLTNTGAVPGTPIYMAPEVGKGQPLTPAYDQYALGTLVYQAISGRLPFTGGDTPFAVVMQRMTGEPLPLASLVPELGSELADAVMRSLAKEPTDRYASCTALAQAMANELGAGESGARPSGSVPMQFTAGIETEAPTVAVDPSEISGATVGSPEEQGTRDDPGREVATELINDEPVADDGPVEDEEPVVPELADASGDLLVEQSDPGDLEETGVLVPRWLWPAATAVGAVLLGWWLWPSDGTPRDETAATAESAEFDSEDLAEASGLERDPGESSSVARANPPLMPLPETDRAAEPASRSADSEAVGEETEAPGARPEEMPDRAPPSVDDVGARPTTDVEGGAAGEAEPTTAATGVGEGGEAPGRGAGDAGVVGPGGIRGPAPPSAPYVPRREGPGLTTFVDPFDREALYQVGWNGHLLVRVADGEAVALPPLTPAEGEDRLRIDRQVPIVASRWDQGVLLVGTQYLKRGDINRGRWERISPDLTTDDPARQAQATIRVIEESPRLRDEIWVATNDGLLHVTRDGGATWQSVTPTVPACGGDRPVRAIALRSDRSGAATVTCGGRLLSTVDWGGSWRVVETGAVGPITHLARPPESTGDLYVASANGVFFSADDGEAWVRLRSWESEQLGTPLFIAGRGGADGELGILSDTGRWYAMPDAPGRPGATDWVDVATDLVPPKLVRSVEPVYPREARRVGREAVVELRVLVDETGRVVDVEAVGEPVGFGFDLAAVKAAREMTWQPATRAGVPTSVWQTVRVSFQPD